MIVGFFVRRMYIQGIYMQSVRMYVQGTYMQSVRMYIQGTYMQSVRMYIQGTYMQSVRRVTNNSILIIHAICTQVFSWRAVFSDLYVKFSVL